jgi:hypothetical protein
MLDLSVRKGSHVCRTLRCKSKKEPKIMTKAELLDAVGKRTQIMASSASVALTFTASSMLKADLNPNR